MDSYTRSTQELLQPHEQMKLRNLWDLKPMFTQGCKLGKPEHLLIPKKILLAWRGILLKGMDFDVVPSSTYLRISESNSSLISKPYKLHIVFPATASKLGVMVDAHTHFHRLERLLVAAACFNPFRNLGDVSTLTYHLRV
ncbi:hypothetical protein EV1_004927 [Malus domestica]